MLIINGDGVTTYREWGLRVDHDEQDHKWVMVHETNMDECCELACYDTWKGLIAAHPEYQAIDDAHREAYGVGVDERREVVAGEIPF